MGKKLNRVYHALLEGAAEGLTGGELYSFVTDKSPKTSSKRIVKASLLALTDRGVKDRRVLEAIYDLAIGHRLASLGVEDDAPEEDDNEVEVPLVFEDLRARLESSVSPLSALQEEAPAIGDGVEPLVRASTTSSQ